MNFLRNNRKEILPNKKSNFKGQIALYFVTSTYGPQVGVTRAASVPGLQVLEPCFRGLNQQNYFNNDFFQLLPN